MMGKTKKKRRLLVRNWKHLHQTWTVRLSIIAGAVGEIYVQWPELNNVISLGHVMALIAFLTAVGRAANQEAR